MNSPVDGVALHVMTEALLVPVVAAVTRVVSPRQNSDFSAVGVTVGRAGMVTVVVAVAVSPHLSAAVNVMVTTESLSICRMWSVAEGVCVTVTKEGSQSVSSYPMAGIRYWQAPIGVGAGTELIVISGACFST